MKELFEFVLDWPKQQKKAGFVLISLSGFFVVMVLSGKMSWEALTSSGTLLGLMVIVLYKVGSGLDPVFDTVFNPSVDFYVRGKQRYFRLNPLGGKMRDERMKAAMFLLKPSKEDPALKPLDKEEIKGI